MTAATTRHAGARSATGRTADTPPVEPVIPVPPAAEPDDQPRTTPPGPSAAFERNDSGAPAADGGSGRRRGQGQCGNGSGNDDGPRTSVADQIHRQPGWRRTGRAHSPAAGPCPITPHSTLALPLRRDHHDPPRTSPEGPQVQTCEGPRNGSDDSDACRWSVPGWRNRRRHRFLGSGPAQAAQPPRVDRSLEHEEGWPEGPPFFAPRDAVAGVLV